LFATLAGLLGWAGNTAVAFITEWSGRLAWLAVPLAMVLVAIVTALTTATIDTYYPPGPPSGQHQRPTQGGPQPPDERPRLPFAVSMLLVVVAIGVAGLGITVGVRYVVGWVTGDEPGVERLVSEVEASDQGLTLTVEEVVQTRHFTRVAVLADNDVGHSVSLPVFNNATLVSRSGAVLQADAFRSDWADSLAPWTTQRGVIVFSGHLADRVRRARLSFATVFGAGFEGPRSMTVSNLRLRPP
jgi:hypothetical protein